MKAGILNQLKKFGTKHPSLRPAVILLIAVFLAFYYIFRFLWDKREWILGLFTGCILVLLLWWFLIFPGGAFGSRDGQAAQEADLKENAVELPEENPAQEADLKENAVELSEENPAPEASVTGESPQTLETSQASEMSQSQEMSQTQETSQTREMSQTQETPRTQGTSQASEMSETQAEPQTQAAEVSPLNGAEGIPYSEEESWALLLVDKRHPIPEDYTFEKTAISRKASCDARIAEDTEALLQAAKEDGVDLYICSGLRSDVRQTSLYERKVNFYRKQGYNLGPAKRLASETVQVPGSSEHEIGLSYDFLTSGQSDLNAEFALTAAGKWLKRRGWEFGFILRYPRNKEDITGVEFEPWHYRYVGKTAAGYIMKNYLTLEEYLDRIGGN